MFKTLNLKKTGGIQRFARHTFVAFLMVMPTVFSVNAQNTGCQQTGCARFSYGLASVNSEQGVLLNALVGGLLGGNISLTAGEWNNLAQADISLQEFLEALRLEAGSGSTSEVLNADVTLLQIIDAVASVLQTDGNTLALNALNALRPQIDLLSPLPPVRIGDLLVIETNEALIAGTGINVLDLLFGSISLFNYNHVLSAPTPVTISAANVGLGSIANGIELYAQISEPPVYSCGGTGTQFYSAAVRIKLNVDLVTVNITQLLFDLGLILPPGVADLNASIGQVEIYTDVARAAGTIQAVDAIAGSLTLQADPAVADLYLGTIADNVFFTRSSIINPATDLNHTTIGALDVSISGVPVTADIDAKAFAQGNDPVVNSLTFNGPFPETQTVGNSATFISNLVSTLLQSLDVQVNAGGLDSTTQPLFDTFVNDLIPVLTTALDQTLTPILSDILLNVVDPLLEALGIGIGEANVRVDGVNEVCFGSITGYAYDDANHNAIREAGENGTGELLFAKLISATEPSEAQEVVPVDGVSGLYSFSGIIEGSYSVILDNNNNISDVTSSKPSQWIGTESPEQIRENIKVKDQDLTDINFGFFHGSKLSGTVLNDNGAGAGTPHDGVQNGEENLLTGIRIEAYNTSGDIKIAETATNGEGQYTLWIPFAYDGVQVQIIESDSPEFISVTGNAGTTGGTYDLEQDSMLFTNVAGTEYSGLVFADVPVNRFIPSGRKRAQPGTVVFFSHTFTSGTQGTVSFDTRNSTSSTDSLWQHVLYLDQNCNGSIDGLDTPVSSPVPVSESEELCIIAKVFVPSAANNNDRFVLNISAGFTLQGTSISYTQFTEDETIVDAETASNLVLGKEVNKRNALPGETLTYTITFSNNSSDSLQTLRILDSTPPYTSFFSADCTSIPPALSNCLIESPGSGNSGSIIWKFDGALPPGANGTVTFTVEIEQ